MKLRNILLLLFASFLSSNLFAISVESGLKLENHTRTSLPGTITTATPCVAGMAGAYPCSNINLLAFVPVSAMGCTTSGSGNTVEGWVDSSTGKEYALMGCSNGVSFLDVSDPVNPVYLGRLPPHNNVNSLWRDIRVYNNRAYVGSEASGHGIQVFDLTRLRGVSVPQTFTENARYAGLGNSHTIFINPTTGFLYAVGSGGSPNVCPSGLHMINVQNPVPVFAGCFGNGIYTHEVTCTTYNGPDTAYDGHEICFSANGPTKQLVVVDVSNKAGPVQLSAKTYAGAGYPHQVWLTEDQQTLLLDDEFDESDFAHQTTTYIWNISDLNNPQLTGNFAHETFSIHHNQYVKGNFVYQSNYQAGLRILDLTNVASGILNEVAYFDVWPYGDSADFEGTWDNYPYLPSGIELVTGIFNPDPPNPPNVAGLFILQPVFPPDFAMSAQNPAVDACGTGTGQTSLDLTPENSYNGNVNLSATGLPGGASAAFAPNPATVPGAATITVTLSGTPGGNYPFTATATDGTLTHNLDMTLNVASAVPPAPALLSPVNGSTTEPFVIHYEWNPVAGAASYDLEVSTAADFSLLVYSANVLDDHHTGWLTLDPTTTYYWRVRANNACGASSSSATFQFTTRARAEILIVDDDDNSPDTVNFYTNALTTLGRTYDVWDALNQHIRHLNEPDSTMMSLYSTVIWTSGDASGGAGAPIAGPSEASETSLTGFLNNGGCLLLSSQEYYADRGSVVNPFMANYLGIGTEDNNVFQTNITGNGIFTGLGSFNLVFPGGFVNKTDRMIPASGPGVQVAFNGNAGTAAISKDGGAFRTIYMAFPLEVANGPAGPINVVQRALEFCAGLHQPDLSVSIVDSPDPVNAGDSLTYTLTISNNGTVTATNTVITDTLPAAVNLISANATQGSGCSGSSQITCNLGNVAQGAPAAVTIVVATTTQGSLSNSASVTSDVADASLYNNSATATSQVNAPCPTIALSPATAPDGTAGVSYNQLFSASGGAGPYTFNSTPLPASLVLSTAGTLSGIPNAAGAFPFTVTATDTHGCTGTADYTLTVAPGCLFCDDFNDNIMPDWTFGKGQWQEDSGSLSGTYTRNTTAIATPLFVGCSQCTVEAKMQTAGGPGNRVSLLSWYVDKKQNVELMMKEESHRWVLKQRSGGAIVAKKKTPGSISPGAPYDVRISYDGINFTVFVDNALLMTMPSGAAAAGSVGFSVKRTTGSFDEINVQ